MSGKCGAMLLVLAATLLLSAGARAEEPSRTEHWKRACMHFAGLATWTSEAIRSCDTWDTLLAGCMADLRFAPATAADEAATCILAARRFEDMVPCETLLTRALRAANKKWKAPPPAPKVCPPTPLERLWDSHDSTRAVSRRPALEQACKHMIRLAEDQSATRGKREVLTSSARKEALEGCMNELEKLPAPQAMADCILDSSNMQDVARCSSAAPGKSGGDE